MGITPHFLILYIHKMNERIQELFKRAGGKTSIHNLMSNPVQHREYNELWDENITKFAELIVRDCLDIAFEVRGKPATDTHYVIGYDRACEKIIDAIKESYGVEE